MASAFLLASLTNPDWGFSKTENSHPLVTPSSFRACLVWQGGNNAYQRWVQRHAGQWRLDTQNPQLMPEQEHRDGRLNHVYSLAPLFGTAQNKTKPEVEMNTHSFASKKDTHTHPYMVIYIYVIYIYMVPPPLHGPWLDKLELCVFHCFVPSASLIWWHKLGGDHRLRATQRSFRWRASRASAR